MDQRLLLPRDRLLAPHHFRAARLARRDLAQATELRLAGQDHQRLALAAWRRAGAAAGSAALPRAARRAPLEGSPGHGSNSSDATLRARETGVGETPSALQRAAAPLERPK
jgi:hypothetical protein